MDDVQKLTQSPQSNSHMMLGSEEDPKDGGAVAGAVFGAVVIYAVWPLQNPFSRAIS